ncbi:MAG: glycosyltransferase family 1 protein [Nitrospirae bacterium]|nr:glycosyltransferase family 1 protein [Nitrospirota bacterium]
MNTRNPHQAPVRPHPAPLSVCVVTETFPPEINGVAMTLGRLTEGMCARGHRLRLVRPFQSRADRPERDGSLFTSPVNGIPLPFYPEVRVGLVGTGWYRDLWRRERPDVVYVATEGPAGWNAVRQAARMGIPTVTGFHTNFHAYGRYYHAEPLQRLVMAYLRAVHNRSACTVVPTEALRAELTGNGFRNVRVMTRGVDCTLFAPARRSRDLRRAWGVENGELVVLHVGRLAPEKNIELAADAFRAIAAEVPSARLVIVGDGPLRHDLARRHPRAIVTGARRGAALAEHYASADLLLFPSEAETFGNVTLEGMASGLAVLAYDYAAAREHIDSGRNGVTVPVGDRDRFVAAALALARDRSGLERLRENARRTALGVAWQAVVARFEELLTRCAQGGMP